MLTLLKKWFFQTQCILCKTHVQNGKNICLQCIEELPWNKISCKYCGVPMDPLENITMICGACLHQTPPFDAVYAAFIYEPPIIQLISQLKFNQNFIIGSVLSQLLLDFLLMHYKNKQWPEVIIPVPLHKIRLAERGYNQAIELAYPFKKLLNIPVDIHLCKRIKQTTTQTTVSARERSTNLKHAFAVTNTHTFRHVAIVDDVLTTGSTVTALSKVLKKSGVECVDVWAVAKTRYIYTS